MSLLFAVDAATSSSLGSFDPTNILLNFGLLGVFVIVLTAGRVLVFKRELDAADKAYTEQIEVKDALIAEKDRQITQLRTERDEHRALVIERENFIRESVVKSNVDLMDRQMELIKIRMEGFLDPVRRRSSDSGE